MDYLSLREREPEVDLESGGTTSEDDGTNGQASANRQTNGIFNWMSTGHFSADGSVNGKCGMNFHGNSPKFGEVVNENVELFSDKNSEDENKENVAPLEKKSVEKPNSKKHTKPPRPPKGPSLDAADQKLVRELNELAMRKRARIERIKPLKKMKAAKASNCCSNLSALIITLIFCLIIISRGLCSRSSGLVSMHGSPAAAVTSSESLISIQFYKSFSPHERNGPGPSTNYLAKRKVSGLGSEEELNKAARHERTMIEHANYPCLPHHGSSRDEVLFPVN